MRFVSMCSCLLSIVVFLFISGCVVNRPSTFAGNNRYLLSSRNVGTTKKTFQWQKIVSHEFASEKALRNFQVVNGEWKISDSKLWAVSGEKNRTVLLTHGKKGPLRIELEVTNYANPDGSIGDITVLLNSENSDGFFRKGYALTTGSYYNNCTTFYKLGKPIAKTEYSPLVSGKPNRVVIELIGGHIRYWLNDQILLETWDPKPLEMDPDLWIGIRTWNTKMSIGSFIVYQEMK